MKTLLFLLSALGCYGQAFLFSPAFVGNTSTASTNAAAPVYYTGPTWVTNGAVAGGTGAITPGVPTGYQANDIFLLFVESAQDKVSTATPTDWNIVTNTSGLTNGVGPSAGTSATLLEVFWRRATASESAPSVADRGNHTVGIITCIRGAETNGYPFNVALAGTKEETNSSVSITGGTTTISNALVLAAVTEASDTTGTDFFSSWANANLGNVTEAFDAGNNSGNGGGIGAAWGYKTNSGAFGATTATCTTNSPNAFWSIAVVGPQPFTPTISVQPVAQSVQTNANATFTVTAAGNPVPTYQWRTNGVNAANVAGYSGATSASFTISNCVLAQSGWTQDVIVANSQGSVTSSAVALTVTETPAYEFVETFDVSGYDNAGWSVTGTVNADNTTNVLSGTQSLAIPTGAQNYISRSVSGSPKYFYFQWKPLTAGGYNYFLYSTDGPGINYSGENSALTWYHGAVSAGGTLAISNNVLYHIWIDWTPGTGVNGTLGAYISTNSTRPGTADATISNGDGTAIGTAYYGAQGSAFPMILDRIIMTTNSIGSNP